MNDDTPTNKDALHDLSVEYQDLVKTLGYELDLSVIAYRHQELEDILQFTGDAQAIAQRLLDIESRIK